MKANMENDKSYDQLYLERKLHEEKLYKKALEKWGYHLQALKLIEEMAELTHAICKHLLTRKTDKITPLVIEEIADVEIVLEQMKLVFGHEAVQKIKEEKLRRLERILEVKP